jgi:hypothetical protein
MGQQTAYWASIVYLSAARTPKTLELLDTVVRFAIAVEMRFKHALACSRAIDYSPQVQPDIPTPGHGSLPSGHSTQAYIIAYVMWEFFRTVRQAAPQTPSGALTDSTTLQTQLLAQARRVALNRTIAGVHFPVDSAAGHVLGTTLAGYFVHRCKVDPATRGTYTPRTFQGEKYDGDQDFDPNEPLTAADAGIPTPVSATTTVLSHPHILIHAEEATGTGSKILAWMWNQAINEWNGKSIAAGRIP